MTPSQVADHIDPLVQEYYRTGSIDLVRMRSLEAVQHPERGAAGPDRADRERGCQLMPRYQKVLWHHDLPDEPVVLYSKIDSGFAVRKVEVYRDGRHEYADRSHSTGTTMLAEKMMPGVDEINQDPDFSATAITAEEFERVWQRAIQGA